MSSAEPQVRYCMTSDGVQIAYAVDGRGARTPLLIMAAPFTDVRISHWGDFGMPLLSGVALGARPTAWFDFRGCGRSDRNVDDVSMDVCKRDLHAVIERLGWRRFSLLALGMPGPLAMKYAAEHPDRVASLILRETYARAADMGRIARMRSLGALARDDYESYLVLITWTVYGWTDEGDEIVRLMADCSPAETTQMYAAATPSYNATAFVENIQARTLIVGREDTPVPSGEMTRQLGARIRDARVVMVKGRGVKFDKFMEEFLAEGDEPLPVPASPGAATGGQLADGPFRTVLFTDIVGHTEMMQRLGDARGREVLREHERITRQTLRAHGGTEVKTDGDSFMVSFGSVTSAIDCAIALQRAFAAHTESMPEALHVRVGLNAGEPIEEDGDLFGSTVILASRIAAHAGAGEILIPEPLRHLLSGKNYVYADRGETMLKGFEDAVRLYEVQRRE